MVDVVDVMIDVDIDVVDVVDVMIDVDIDVVDVVDVVDVIIDPG